MRYNNVLNSIKERIPYNLLQKALVQLAIASFSIAIGYYGINLIVTTEEKMNYSFSGLETISDEENMFDDNINDEVDELKININTATKEELMTLPNIGAKKAEEIINYRDDNAFVDIEEIMEVSGIGSKTFDTLKDLITI